MYGDAVSEKIAAVTLGVFGVVYQILMVAFFLGAIASVDIEAYFMGVSMLLVFHLVAMAFVFRRAMSNAL